jgi:uncharacterized protein (UPF0303 family)
VILWISRNTPPKPQPGEEPRRSRRQRCPPLPPTTTGGWSARRRVARRYGRSSFGVGLSFRAAGKSFETDGRLDPTQCAAHGGVFPIAIEGVGVVATVGVSGLPQAEDHTFVVEQLRDWKARAAAGR